MKIRIAIPGYERILALIHTIRANYSSEIEFAVVSPDAFTGHGGDLIRAMEQSGDVDIFVASGSAYACFEQYVERTPVVQVRPSGFDLLSAISEIPAKCRKAAILMSQERIPQIAAIKSTVRLKIADYVYQDLHALTQILNKLYNDGYEHIIGNTQAIEQAELLGMTGHYIWSTKSYLDALDVAIKVITNQRRERLYAQQVSLILQNIHEGVLVTSGTGALMQYNESAQKILGTSLCSAVGKDIGTVLPNLSLPPAASAEPFSQVVTIGDKRKILANASPLSSKRLFHGYVITFQSTQELSKANEKIRNTRDKGFSAKTHFSDMIGQSPAFIRTTDVCRRYAAKESTILLYGETGTGKDLLAQSIHNASTRKNARFVAVNCAAMPADLLESELFGYEEGAFTGARKGGKPGLFELADGGTIFLDEIGEITPKFQSRLLRVLEQREIMRLGSDSISHIDIRVIAATNKNLAQMVRENLFREDLFYRLNILEVNVPPLRARKSDIPLLIRFFLDRCDLHLDEQRRQEISSNPLFVQYDWPGNIRELSNVIERFCALYSPEFSPDSLIAACIRPQGAPAVQSADTQAIRAALEACGGNRKAAASMLGISRSTLWRLIKKYGIEFDRFKTF